MGELEKHIQFAEKQFLVYKYHNNPDKLKMEALYKFLLSLKNNTNANIPKNDTAPEDKTIQKSNKPHGALFDISEFVTKNK